MKNKFRNITVQDKKYRYYFNKSGTLIIIGNETHLITRNDPRTNLPLDENMYDKHKIQWIFYGSKNITIAPKTIADFIKTHKIQ